MSSLISSEAIASLVLVAKEANMVLDRSKVKTSVNSALQDLVKNFGLRRLTQEAAGGPGAPVHYYDRDELIFAAIDKLSSRPVESKWTLQKEVLYRTLHGVCELSSTCLMEVGELKELKKIEKLLDKSPFAKIASAFVFERKYPGTNKVSHVFSVEGAALVVYATQSGKKYNINFGSKYNIISWIIKRIYKRRKDE